jgi:hypothetical protein
VPAPVREALAVDARARADGVTAWTRVAGVPLVARHIRQAARDGWRAVTVLVAGAADRAAVERALAERPARGVTVDFAEVAPAGARVVPALAIYRAGWEPLATLASAADVEAAERHLYASLRKSLALDGVVAYHVMRPLGRLGTRALVDTAVRPDQVTLAAFLFGVAAAVAAAHRLWALAGLALWLGAVVDCIDGELARLRIEGSRRGEWLDSIADELSTFSLLVGLGLGLGGAWRLIGAAGALIGIATTGKLYFDLHRLQLPIDTAQYPWFFGKPSERAPTRRGLARGVYIASFLFQRDAYVTVVALGLLAQAPRVAFLLLFGGMLVITVLLFIHVLVTALTKHDSPPPH